MKLLFSTAALLFVLLSLDAYAQEERFQRITVNQMTPDQRQYFDDLMADPSLTGGNAAAAQGTNSVPAPFNVLMRSPKLARALNTAADELRFHSSLPTRLNEFAILIAARHWGAQFAWHAHSSLALKAGLDPKISEQLARGERPEAMGREEAAIYDFCHELLSTHQVNDANYTAVRELFGEQGVVDLIVVSGYYVLVSMILNIDRAPLPTGVAPAFPGPSAAR